MKYKNKICFILAFVFAFLSFSKAFAFQEDQLPRDELGQDRVFALNKEDKKQKVYNIKVSAKKSDDVSKASMFDEMGLLNHKAKVVEKDNKYFVSIEFKDKLPNSQSSGEITYFALVEGNQDKLLKMEKGSNDYPQSFKIEFDKEMDKVLIRVGVKAMGNANQKAYLVFDWKDKEEIKDQEDKPEEKPEEDKKQPIDTDKIEVDIYKKILLDEINRAKEIKIGDKGEEAFRLLQREIEFSETLLKFYKSKEEISQAKVQLYNAILEFYRSASKTRAQDSNLQLGNNEFSVPITLLKANEDTSSMASGAIISPCKIRVENNRAYAEIRTQTINFGGVRGRLVDVRNLSGGLVRMTNYGFEIEVPFSATKEQVDIRLQMTTDAMPIPQEARLRFNGSGAVGASSNNNQSNIQNSISLLNNAIHGAVNLNKKDFTDESWTRFERVLNEAKAISLQKNSSQDKIDQATRSLNEAKNSLVKTSSTATSSKAEKSYELSVTMKKVGGGVSMANGALVQKAKVELENGKYKYYLFFKGIEKEFGGKSLKGNLTKLFYFDGSKIEANNEGNNTWSIKLDSKVNEIKIAIWVDIMDQIMGGGQGAGEQEAVIELDWSSAKEVGSQKTNSIITNKKISFNDIDNHWAKDAINYVAEKGYFKGTYAGKFEPNRSITRGELITVLGRIQEVNTESYRQGKFVDVKEGEYYFGYINWAFENGLIKEFENKKFKPNKILNREEMATIINNYINFSNIKIGAKKREVNYKDKEEISAWSKEAINNLTSMGILSGMEDGSFSPKGDFTRSQIAQVLYNLDNKIVK